LVPSVYSDCIRTGTTSQRVSCKTSSCHTKASGPSNRWASSPRRRIWQKCGQCCLIGRSASPSVDHLCSRCQTRPKQAGKATKAPQSRIQRAWVLVRAHLGHLMGMRAAQVCCFSLGAFCPLIFFFDVGQTTTNLRTLIVSAQLRIHNIQCHMCQCRRSNHLM
jgi:hypothetical protein